MSSGNSAGLVTALTTTAGLVAAVLGIVKYFNYRTKRDRIAAVGTAFEAVVEALASDDDVKRIAAAIRLRRFFDPRGELATGGLWPRFRQLRAREGHQAERATNQNATAGTTEGMPRHRARLWKLTRDELPYAADALNVIVAILREQPPGNFQKLLADALTKAPKELLAGADIQKANLQNAWLGPASAPGSAVGRPARRTPGHTPQSFRSNGSFRAVGQPGASDRPLSYVPLELPDVVVIRVHAQVGEAGGAERIPSPHGLASYSPERATGSFVRFGARGGSVQ
jgi:hypothetical protein